MLELPVFSLTMSRRKSPTSSHISAISDDIECAVVRFLLPGGVVVEEQGCLRQCMMMLMSWSEIVVKFLA